MEESLKKRLHEVGLNDAQITVLEDKHGLSRETHLKYITREYLLEAGVKSLDADEILDKLKTPATTPQPSGSPGIGGGVTRIELYQKPTIYDMKPKELLELMATGEDEEERRAAGEELDTRARQLPCVVVSPKGIDVAESLACFNHIRSTNQRLELWKANPVKRANALAGQAKIPVDPTDGTPLVEGVNPNSLVDWNGVSEDRRVLVRFAWVGGRLRGRDLHQVAEELKRADLTPFWKQMQTLLNAGEETREGTIAQLKRELYQRPQGRLFEEPVPQPPPRPIPGPGYGGATTQDVMSRDYQRALRKVLSQLNHDVQRVVAEDARLDISRIEISGSPETSASAIIAEASRQGIPTMNRLIAQVMDRLPGQFPLRY